LRFEHRRRRASKALWKVGRSSRDNFVTSGRRRDAPKEAFAIERWAAILDIFATSPRIYIIVVERYFGVREFSLTTE
jgi:hypothetical protein